MPTAHEKPTKKARYSGSRNFVELEDGVYVDIDQVQAYRHQEGSLGVIYLVGGGEVLTHCGQELIFHIMDS